MKEKVEIKIKYAGKDVDDGSMSIEDIVPALQGFASAYGKIANIQGIETKHKLRITGVQKGSFDVLLEAWNSLPEDTKNIAMGSLIAGGGFGIGKGALWVVKQMIDVVKVTKHTKKKPYSESINADNNSVVIKNCDNVKLEIPLDVYNLFKNNIIAQDLQKITKPLEEGQVDYTKIIAKSDEEEFEEDVKIEEKKFFEVEEVIVSETKETWLTGTLNSLTKTTNKGFFLLNDGTRVTYSLASENPEDLYKYFILKGSVRVRCKAYLDENLKPSRIDIYEIEQLQGDLFQE